ncbi:hypothetical protein [Desulfosporosinus metallidurans]|uniref:Uncharacterized protein n=1 Tax=Desulfosporosinus metallidurans TaxID=1888891 RepID=A0A1Q8QFW6_9FIRM|nr:hypothetical protein [Desulfosporosinus metallidurans]OLN26243.1 hypothetical protein DSOL_5071 [Desulfosporosinus metallidurans]
MEFFATQPHPFKEIKIILSEERLFEKRNAIRMAQDLIRLNIDNPEVEDVQIHIFLKEIKVFGDKACFSKYRKGEYPYFYIYRNDCGVINFNERKLTYGLNNIIDEVNQGELYGGNVKRMVKKFSVIWDNIKIVLI